MNKKVLKQAQRHLKLSKTLNLSVLSQALILLAISGIVLYAVFFATYPDVHDYFHELRHGMMMIPCH
jgi:hypothetical protein